MKLLLDEMLAAVIARQLRGRSYDVVAVDERLALRGLPDPDLFKHAQQEQRAIVTYNREDFLALDRQYRNHGRGHHGIVILNPRRFPQGMGSIEGAHPLARDAHRRRGPVPGLHPLAPAAPGTRRR